jgi:branched-chain amino acid transport system permease protein/urea transport system permease protein
MNSIVVTVLNGVSLASVLILISLGLAVIFGLRGVINLAHGEFFMLGAYTVWITEVLHLPPFWVGFVLAPFVTGLIGWLIERGFIRFLYRRPLDTLLGTWGVSIVLRELVRIVAGPEYRYATQPITGQFQMLGFSYPLYRMTIIAFTAVVVTGVILLFRRTDFGLRVQATIADRNMAEAVGINTARVDQVVFVLGAALAGLAGAVMSPVSVISPNMGLDYFTRTFLVVILGGIGNMLGVLGGGMLIGTMEALLSAALKPIVAQIIVLAFAILVIRLRPQGLFGKAE